MALLIFAVVLVKLIYCCCVVSVLVKRLVSSRGTGSDDGKTRPQVFLPSQRWIAFLGISTISTKISDVISNAY